MNIRTFEAFVRRMANRIGIDVHRHRPRESQYGLLSKMLERHGVDLILDIGANTGQFASSMREAGYRGRLVSFEPLPAAHTQLLRNSRSDSGWEIAPPMAIGDYDGEIDMHVAGNSVSSSALVMLKAHVRAAPGSEIVSKERARVAPLDMVARKYLGPDTVPFVKIDTQGYEDRVLDGAAAILESASGLQLELSFVPLYEGQQHFETLLDRISALGFSIWAVWPGFHDPCSGRMLQVDATFFRD